MKIIKFTEKATGRVSYFSGTFNYTAKLGGIERYNDVGISWCNNPADAMKLSDHNAEKYVSDWRGLFVGSTIEAVTTY